MGRRQRLCLWTPRRVFDPLDTLFAIALSALSCRVRVLMQEGLICPKHK